MTNNSKTDEKVVRRADEVLRRMLNTPPKPHVVKKPLTKPGQKKPDGASDKSRRPEGQ